MTVLSIENVNIKDGYAEVTAVVDEMLLVYPATRFEPAEYGPAICEATIELDPSEPIPLDEDGFCAYLDQVDPEWRILNLSNY